MQAETRTILDSLNQYLDTPLDEALALPAQAYTSQEFFELEMEYVFRREWVCVGRDDEIAEPGSFFTHDLFGEPLVIVRGHDGEIRALSSVCRHRNHMVVEGSGKVSNFVCPYHRWTYHLDGALKGAPYMERNRRFAKDECRLPEFPLEIWEGFLFVNLDRDAPPLAPRLRTLQDDAANVRYGDHVTTSVYDHVWECNWKVGWETSVETYHHMGLHRETAEPVMPTSTIEVGDVESTDDAWCYHRTEIIPAVLKSLETNKTNEQLTEEERSHSVVYSVWPAFCLMKWPFQGSWLTFHPIDAHRTRVRAGICLHKDDVEGVDIEKLGESQRPGMDRINTEDQVAAELVMRGLHSQSAARGPLSWMEAGIYHFGRYLARRLNGAGQVTGG